MFAEQKLCGKVVFIHVSGVIPGGKVSDCGERMEFTQRGSGVMDVKVC